MDRYIKYTHPAAQGYNPDRVYLYDEIAKKLSLEEIKIFFTPIDFKWEELDGKSKVVTSIKAETK